MTTPLTRQHGRAYTEPAAAIHRTVQLLLATGKPVQDGCSGTWTGLKPLNYSAGRAAAMD